MSRNVYTILDYTADWDESSGFSKPSVELGDVARFPIDDTPDARELRGFLNAVQRAGADLYYVDSDEAWNEYEVVPAEDRDSPGQMIG